MEPESYQKAIEIAPEAVQQKTLKLVPKSINKQNSFQPLKPLKNFQVLQVFM